jgi:hypothetical protein
MDEGEVQYEVLEASLIDYGHFGKDEGQIIYIEDFVDKDDLAYIQRFANSIDTWENALDDAYNEEGDCIYAKSYWWDRVCSGRIIEELDLKAFSIIEHYIHKMASVIEEKHSVEVHERPPVLVRWLPGNKQEPHADKQLNDGKPNPFPLYDINSIIYWNDDFEGGEFYYPEFNKEFKIKAGMAVCHPGDVNYLHGVKEIRSGIRWTTPSFYTITNFKEK